MYLADSNKRIIFVYKKEASEMSVFESAFTKGLHLQIINQLRPENVNLGRFLAVIIKKWQTKKLYN